MTSCHTTQNKPNCFDPLVGEAVEEHKDPDPIEQSSITFDYPALSDDDTSLKETFVLFQQKTNDQFEQMEDTFCGIAEALTAIDQSLGEIHSRQNAAG